MTTFDEDQSLAELAAPALDERFAARVLAMAKQELVQPEPAAAAVTLRRAVGGLLVPALLTSAAGCSTAVTVQTAEKVFQSDGPSESPGEPPKP